MLVKIEVKNSGTKFTPKEEIALGFKQSKLTFGNQIQVVQSHVNQCLNQRTKLFSQIKATGGLLQSSLLAWHIPLQTLVIFRQTNSGANDSMKSRLFITPNQSY